MAKCNQLTTLPFKELTHPNQSNYHHLTFYDCKMAPKSRFLTIDG